MRKTHIMGEYPFYNNNRIIQLISLILLIIITTTTQTTLAEASKCQLGCSNDAAGGILKYVAGQVYEYAVTSDLNVGLATGGTNNNAKNEGGISMKISAIAKLYADNNCAYTLQLTNVDVASSESESATKKQLTNLQHPVHFTMQHDGHVAPTLCIDANEDEHALNIKRAIISLLQNQIPDGSSDFHTETDIFGECATRSSQRASDKGGIILTKVRNLGACAKHAHLQTGLMAGGVLHGSSLAHGLSNLQADYFKEATINAAGLVEQVEATETYANAVQTQNGATSAKARVATSLKLKTPGVPATAPKAGQHETGLIFEAPNSSGETKNLAALKKSLNEVVSKINGVQVQQNAASHLVELIRLMRTADGATLLELSQTNGDLERKVYLDALFRVATAASAHAILKQLPKMSAKEQFLAVASLHLVKSVDQDTLKAATALLSGNPPKGAHMAIGHLVNKYCQNHKVDCSSDVAEIAQQFAGSLKQCKAATVEDEERIIATLKGLGNMAHYVASNAAVTEALTQCLANAHGVAQRVRVASLQSVASVASCHDGLHKRALELFKDRHEDAELRIEAYLVAIECANDETAHAINEVLQDEPSYQVGGFVVSNLRVLRDSTDASRAQQRAHLLPIISLDTKTNSYPTNWHRYSFNHEVSYKLPALGMSASADVKMLYSQQPGFLPRATRLNVTSELYGNHVNILDLSVRQENMERILEYYLGPKGLLNKDFEQIVQSVSHNVRSRRSLATDAQKHAKKYKTYGQKQHGIKDINFDMSVKLFGSEIGFLSLGDNLPQTLDDLMHLLSTGFEAVKKDLQGFERQFHMHTLFLDSHLMYATSMGVPLEFTAQGVAASQFDMAAKLDIDALLSDNWQSAKYRVKFVPSIDATIQLSLGFHTPLMATGMRVSSKMHTATGSDINMSFGHDGKSFKADIDLPQQRLELINLHASSDYYVSEADKAETKSIALDKSAGADDVPKADSICFNQLEDYTGFDFCIITNVMQMDWSNGEAANKWPLLQPLTLGIYVTAPPKLSLSAEKNTNEETGIRSLSLQYKTPGSAESHDTQLLFTLHCKEKNARVELNNPKLKLAAEMGLKNDARELLIYAQYEKDGKRQRSKIGFEKLTANEFKPVIELYNLMSGEVQHNVAGYEASGKLRLEPDLGRYNFEKFAISQNNGENQLVEVNGWAQLKNGAAKTDLKLTLANKRTYVIDSHAQMPGSGAYDVGIFVHDDKQPDHVYGGSLNAKILPNDVSVNVVAKAAAYEIDLQNKAKYALKDEAQELKSLTAAHALKVQHKQQMVGAVHLTVDVESNKELKFSLDLERKPHHSSVNLQLQRNEGDFGVDFKANYNKHSVALAAKGAKLPDNGRTQVDGKFTSSWGTNGALQGQIGDSFAPQLIYINLNGHFGLSQEKPKHASLKVVGANDKTTADVGLKTDTEDLVKFNGEWQQHAGKMHMVLHQVLDTKADYKLAKNGKGEFNMQADLVDKAKKINVNGKFHIVPASKYDIDANVLYNDEQVLHVKSDNVVDKNKFSTASVVNMGEKKLALNAHATSKGEWRQNGELMANFDLTLPSGRRIDGEGKRKLTTNPKNGMVSGNAEWQVTDTNSEGKKHILSAKGKLEKLIPAQRLLINEAQWHYTNPDNQDMELKLKFKHVPKNNGQTHALDMQLQTAGSLLKNPMELNIKSDEYGQLAAKLEAHAKYGDKIDTKVSGAYDLSGYKSNKKPIDYEFKIEGKHGELQGKGKWQRPHAGQAGILQTTFEHKMGESESQLDFKAAGTQHKSSYDLSFKCNKMQAPLKVNGAIEVQPQQGLEISLNAVQGDKFLKTRLESKLLKTEADYELKFNLEQSESAALRDLEVQLKAHALNSHDYRLSVDAVHNKEHKYGMETLLHGGGSAQHGLEFYLSAPQLPQKMSIVALSQINADPQHAKLTLELSQVLGLDLKAAADAKYHDVEDFSLLVNWHSDKLSLKQYVLSIGTQEGKKLHVSLKNAEGTILDGTASHVVKQHDAAKFIVEGQGELEYRGKSQQGNFRLIRQTYEVGTDKEMGVSYTLNGQVGTRQGVANLKLTNREFNVKLSVCEEKKPCTNLQLQSLVNLSDDDQSSKHSLLVLIDLRELGHPYEFELQSKTQRQGFKAQYSLDSSLVSHNSQRYQLIANLATSGAGRVLIKLPKRDILLELQQKIPANNAIMGNYEQSLTLWLDHVGQPQHMTKLSGSASLSGDAGIDAHGKLKLEHTGMRTLSGEAKLQANRAQQVLSAELNLDIFKQAEQQLSFTHKVQNLLAGETAAFNITAFSELKAPAYELNYHMGGHSAYQQHKYTSQMGMALNDLSASSLLIVSPEHGHFEIEALSDMLALLDASWSRTTNGGLESHAKLQILAQEPLDVETQVEATGAKISVKQGGAFDAGAAYKLGKELSVEVNGPKGEKYVNGRVSLEKANFLETTYTSDLEQLKEHLKLQYDTKAAMEKLSGKLDKLKNMVDKQRDNIVHALPDMQPLIDHVKSNLQQIVQELEADPMIKHLAQISRKIYEAIEKFVHKVSKDLDEFHRKLSEILRNMYKKAHDAMEQSILPVWKELAETAAKLSAKVRGEIVQVTAQVWENFMKFMEKYGPVLRNYALVVHDALKAIHERLESLHQMLQHEFDTISHEIKDMLAHFKMDKLEPLVEKLKEHWQHWKINEQLIDMFNQLFEQFNVLPQTEESNEFLTQLHSYLTAKLQHTETPTSLETLVQLALKAVRSLLAELAAHTNSPHLSHLMGWSPKGGHPPFMQLWTSGVNMLTKLPAILSMRFSLINLALNEPWAKHPLPWVSWYSWLHPFDLNAHLVNNAQYVSYDGVYGDFRADGANCKFILAQDSIDQNFTLVAHTQNQKLRSLTLLTHDGETLEIMDNGALKVNGQPAEYPHHGADLHAWHMHYTVWIRSQYGIEVACVTDLTLCHLTVNGFYAGRLRGMLGNANAEPFDDAQLPEGTVAVNNKDFVQAYNLAGKCVALESEAPVAVNNEAANDDICSELFGWHSALSAGFLMANAKPYREGCHAAIKGLEGDKSEELACHWALSYVTALRLHKIPVAVPSRCLKCQDKTLKHEQQIKLPGNKADIVFVVDVNVKPAVMEQLVAPVLGELREALKARSFSDIQIGVVAYNESQRYPALLTSNGGKLNYEGNLAEFKLDGGPTSTPCDGCFDHLITNSKILDILKHLQNAVQNVLPSSETQAFDLAFRYPFRAQATSTIVGVRGTPANSASLLHFLEAYAANKFKNFHKTILHVITPIEKMSVEGISDDKLIGFNSRLIATLDGKDAKKRSKLVLDNSKARSIDLVLNTGGWIFNTEHFESLKPQERKKALNQISSTIADTTFKTELITECTCDADYYALYAEPKCHVISTNFVANKKVKAKK